MALLRFLQLIVSASVASADLFKLDFRNIAVRQPAYLRSELNLPVYNDFMHQRYIISLAIGTPPQNFSLAIDTGSADLFVPQMSSSGCSPSCPPGTFNPELSRTVRPTGFTFNATYGLTPDLMVAGPYLNDTVRLGRATIPNMTGTLLWLWASASQKHRKIGLGNLPKPLFDAGNYGLLGLGSRLAESIYRNPSSPYAQKASATFPTIYDQLKHHGYIDRWLFSLWLDDETASTGTILFAGIDTSKFEGELRSIPVLLSGPDQVFIDWAINLNSVVYVNNSGSPNMYLPQALADSVSAQMGAISHEGFPYVPCSIRQSYAEQLEFDFNGDQGGPRIQVPFPEIIYPFGYPANLGNVTADDGSPLCYLGLIGTAGSVYLLGDTFIRSAYIVYDVDNLQVSMAPVLYGKDRPTREVRLQA